MPRTVVVVVEVVVVPVAGVLELVQLVAGDVDVGDRFTATSQNKEKKYFNYDGKHNIFDLKNGTYVKLQVAKWLW